jgi:hypothetical protein
MPSGSIDQPDAVRWCQLQIKPGILWFRSGGVTMGFFRHVARIPDSADRQCETGLERSAGR